MTRVTVGLADHPFVAPPRVGDLRWVAAPLSPVLTDEVDGAAHDLCLPLDALLLAALVEAIRRTAGASTVAIDVACPGGEVLPVPMTPGRPEQVLIRALTALDTLAGFGQPASSRTGGDVLFVGSATGPAAGAAQPLAAGRHLLVLHVRRLGTVLELDWGYDARALHRYTVAELAEQFELALIALTGEALPRPASTVALPC